MAITRLGGTARTVSAVAVLVCAGILAFAGVERERRSLPDPIAVGAAPAGSSDSSEVAFREVEARTLDPLDGSVPAEGDPADEVDPSPGVAGEETDPEPTPVASDAGDASSAPPVDGEPNDGTSPTAPATTPTTVSVDAGVRVNRPPATTPPPEGSATTLPPVTVPSTTIPPVTSVPPVITSVTELIDDLLGIDLTRSGS